MRYIQHFLLALLLFFGFTFFPKEISAVTITIDNSPPDISESPFSVSFSVSGAASADNYFRIDLFKDGSSSYFGETYNGSDWYNGSDGKQYLKAVMVSGQTANITVQGRLGNPSSSEFLGPGLYKLKIRRYTASGTAATTDNQTPGDINITYTTPTPSPSPTPTHEPTQSPTPQPTNTPTSTATLTPTPTPKPTPTTKSSPTQVPEVLGESGNEDPNLLTFSETFGRESSGGDGVVADNSKKVSNSVPPVAALFVVGGALLIGYAIFPFIKQFLTKRGKSYNTISDEGNEDKKDT